ncbi:MAG: TerB family tellurite resistance protein [Rhodospirillales bacterium]|nr:TerB family tellurite resistance protein [Rhodospirillales bacterium]MDE2319337.1 TerB family tellurite resistance protein [Rhodospirillales bacterium]
MSYWGKFIGGMAGFAMGGPVGALFGAALGHAADGGKLHGLASGFSSFAGRAMPIDPLRIASMLGRRDQIFAIGVTVLAAKLCKCDGPVSRLEIDSFKQSFAIPSDSVSEVARLFDNARDSSAGYEAYAIQLGQAFSDEKIVLEQVLAGLYQIAKADGPVNGAEADFLSRVAFGFGLSDTAARRAGRGVPPPERSEDPYLVLGVGPQVASEEIRVRWKQLMREHHPDTMASKGAPAATVKAASERVARINAAYDAIKRERGL